MARPLHRRVSWIRAARSRWPSDAASGHAPGQDRAAQERAFEPSQPVHAAAPEARRLADRVKTRNRPVLSGLHATLQVHGDAAETLAAHHEHANAHDSHGPLLE